MNRTIVALATALILTGFAAGRNDARAEVVRETATARTSPNHLSRDIKQARIETSGAQTFILNGHRILVPANANAEAVIKALKARYPGLKSDTDVSVAD